MTLELTLRREEIRIERKKLFAQASEERTWSIAKVSSVRLALRTTQIDDCFVYDSQREEVSARLKELEREAEDIKKKFEECAVRASKSFDRRSLLLYVHSQCHHCHLRSTARISSGDAARKVNCLGFGGFGLA